MYIYQIWITDKFIEHIEICPHYSIWLSGKWYMMAYCLDYCYPWYKSICPHAIYDSYMPQYTISFGRPIWPGPRGLPIWSTLVGVLPHSNKETYIDGLDTNDIQTDTATQPVWAIAIFRGMIPTFIPLWVEQYKSDSSLQQFDFWSSWCFELSRTSFSFP